MHATLVPRLSPSWTNFILQATNVWNTLCYNTFNKTHLQTNYAWTATTPFLTPSVMGMGHVVIYIVSLSSSRLAWQIRALSSRYLYPTLALSGAYEQRSCEGPCNSGSIQIQITYVFPFWKYAMRIMRSATGASALKKAASPNSEGSQDLQIYHVFVANRFHCHPFAWHFTAARSKALRWVSVKFSHCYHRTRGFICHHYDAQLKNRFPLYLEVR